MRADYQTCRSRAGFRIALARLPESECSALSVHVPAGGRDDPAGLAGLAHFVEHMSFKGTDSRTARCISIETEDAGASLNAFTSEDQTVYEGRGDADCLPLLADIVSDMVWRSNFPESEIGLERDVIAEEIVMYYESPTDHIGDLISGALWTPHPLGEPIAGTLESVARVDRQALLDFTSSHHRREDVVISVAGPFTMEQVLEHLEPHLPQALPAPPCQPYIGPAGGTSELLEARETAQVQLALAYRTFGRTDPRRHPARLLATILGDGASSRLFQKLREERGLCYQIGCDVTFLADTGALEIHAGLDPDSRDEALACIREELDDLARNGPDETELARAKRLHESQTRATMESTAAHASWIGDCVLHHDEVITPEAALAELAAVAATEVRDVARELIQPENEALAEIHPV
ncbi:peptidase M16 [Haloferula helveola]|uniref:Peptidase M16 n=1 Tax=Haloferula helveola TaxID=490095 RepID=A0ABM7RH12_9BACT|nr:peptidase M16 [Haloferula helveola]